jgi:hypothetical protein
MRILFPASFYVRGGVERVLLSLVQEFDHLVEQVVVMLPSEALIAEVKAKLPNTHKVFTSYLLGPPRVWLPKQIDWAQSGSNMGRTLGNLFSSSGAREKYVKSSALTASAISSSVIKSPIAYIRWPTECPFPRVSVFPWPWCPTICSGILRPSPTQRI